MVGGYADIVRLCEWGGGTSCGGTFLGGIDYMGIEFDISGDTHYGWVEIESSQFFHGANILRWAY